MNANIALRIVTAHLLAPHRLKIIKMKQMRNKA